jgi:hypothetical protein
MENDDNTNPTPSAYSFNAAQREVIFLGTGTIFQIRKIFGLGRENISLIWKIIFEGKKKFNQPRKIISGTLEMVLKGRKPCGRVLTGTYG